MEKELTRWRGGRNKKARGGSKREASSPTKDTHDDLPALVCHTYNLGRFEKVKMKGSGCEELTTEQVARIRARESPFTKLQIAALETMFGVVVSRCSEAGLGTPVTIRQSLYGGLRAAVGFNKREKLTPHGKELLKRVVHCKAEEVDRSEKRFQKQIKEGVVVDSRLSVEPVSFQRACLRQCRDVDAGAVGAFQNEIR